MRELHIHFFGCSFTAGDELSDEKWFPWKFTETHTARSFYIKRSEMIQNWEDWELYQFENKQRAYPKLITTLDPNINTTCYSLNGKSLRRNIFDIIKLVEENQEKVDCIYLQISPTDREMIFNKSGQQDIQLRNPVQLSAEYITEKLKITIPENQTLHDTMDMYMIDAYLKLKGIPFYFINFTEHLLHRKKDIADVNNNKIGQFNFLSIDKFSNIIDIMDLIERENLLLGGHLAQYQHQLIAEYILNHIKGQFK